MRLQESRRLFPDAPQGSRRTVEVPRADDRLFDLIAWHRQVHGGAAGESSVRSGRAYLILLVASLVVWLLIGYAIYLIVSAAA
jgi:hypothetical protein